MKKILKENIFEIILIAGAPILYLWFNSTYVIEKNKSMELKAIILSIIMIIPFVFLARILSNLEKYSTKKFTKNILIVGEFVLLAPEFLVILKLVNTISTIYLFKIFSAMFLSVSGMIFLIILFFLIGIISIVAENVYTKYVQ